MSQTPQQQLTYPVPLQIEWKTEPFPDSTSGALVVRDPNTLLAKLGLQGTWQSHDGSLPTFAQFCEWMQGLMVQEINNQLRALEPLITSLTERLAAREMLHLAGLPRCQGHRQGYMLRLCHRTRPTTVLRYIRSLIGAP